MRKHLGSIAIVLLLMLVVVHSASAVQLPGLVVPVDASEDSYVATLPSGNAVVAGISLTTMPLPSYCATQHAVVATGTREDHIAPNAGGSGLPLQAGAFNIVINPGSGLAGNSAALAAFNRAAALWETRISDPITVTISGDMMDLGSGGIIGSTMTVLLEGGYTTIRDVLVADALDEPDDSVAQALPTASQCSVAIESDFLLSGKMIAAKAGLKAMGFTGLDETFGTEDADISFNTQFAFDFDRSNGVAPGTMDFESIATHEIGHALGFISMVDVIDVLKAGGGSGLDVPISALDMFRFNDGTLDPETLAEFTTTPRSLVVGGARNTDQILPWGDLTAAELPMSTGINYGDGRQASHWRDDMLSGTWLGLMDPTFSYGQVAVPAESDFRALDLIGYEISPIPEPGTLGLVVLGMVCLALGRRSGV